MIFKILKINGIIKLILNDILVILILLPKRLMVEPNIIEELTSWKVLLPKCQPNNF